jgi:hypothetical protein
VQCSVAAHFPANLMRLNLQVRTALAATLHGVAFLYTHECKNFEKFIC